MATIGVDRSVSKIKNAKWLWLVYKQNFLHFSPVGLSTPAGVLQKATCRGWHTFPQEARRFDYRI
jgi:hypothetical protein